MKQDLAGRFEHLIVQPKVSHLIWSAIVWNIWQQRNAISGGAVCVFCTAEMYLLICIICLYRLRFNLLVWGFILRCLYTVMDIVFVISCAHLVLLWIYEIYCLKKIMQRNVRIENNLKFLFPVFCINFFKKNKIKTT